MGSVWGPRIVSLRDARVVLPQNSTKTAGKDRAHEINQRIKRIFRWKRAQFVFCKICAEFAINSVNCVGLQRPQKRIFVLKTCIKPADRIAAGRCQIGNLYVAEGQIINCLNIYFQEIVTILDTPTLPRLKQTRDARLQYLFCCVHQNFISRCDRLTLSQRDVSKETNMNSDSLL